jgi:hypothetical protein
LSGHRIEKADISYSMDRSSLLKADILYRQAAHRIDILLTGQEISCTVRQDKH